MFGCVGWTIDQGGTMSALTELQPGTTKLSRKAFLASGIAAISGMAFAKPVAADVVAVSAEEGTAAEAELLWQEAVRRAEEEGEYVSDFIPAGSHIAPASTLVKATSMNTVIKAVPTVVTASASLDVNGIYIGSVLSAWITASAATVTDMGYRYTKVDAGRTVCIDYWCSITPATKLPATCQFYAEFHSTGSGWMRGGPVA